MTLHEFAAELYPNMPRRAGYERARRLLRYLPDRAVIRAEKKVLLRRPLVERFLNGDGTNLSGDGDSQ